MYNQSRPFIPSGTNNQVSSYPNWRPNTPSGPPRIICQLCDKPGHGAKTCRSRGKPSWPQAHYLNGEPGSSNNNWILDSGATHHITSDLQNLSMQSEYAGSEDVIVGNGNGISISHIGSSTVDSPSTSFTLDNILCAPLIKKNLISVSQFCR